MASSFSRGQMESLAARSSAQRQEVWGESFFYDPAGQNIPFSGVVTGESASQALVLGGMDPGYEFAVRTPYDPGALQFEIGKRVTRGANGRQLRIDRITTHKAAQEQVLYLAKL